MLRELSVQNLALIEDVRVELQPGFCAWTGETGAGKTLLLEALGLLLGERGAADLIRAGAEELRIVGRFELTPDLRREIERLLNGPLDDEEIIVTSFQSCRGSDWRSSRTNFSTPRLMMLLTRVRPIRNSIDR